ncbi:MAG: acyl-CoA thioesterase [Crocinitomicaceae bacterium]|nr:acyl-CoA thioesterase [Crocinitomicaceae bacterium]
MKVDFKSTTTLRVRYGETDQMGYCYYGNYAQYFEVGRVEALRDIGLSYKRLEDRGVMLPVADFQVSYKVPAKYDDKLTVITHINEIKGPRLIFNYSIINEAGKIVATATTVLVFVSKVTMRPIAPPEDFISIMLPYEI